MQERLPQDDAQYRAALGRVARAIRVSAEQLEQTILAGAEGQEFGPDCVSIDEIDRHSSLQRFPPERRRHVESCRECQQFLAAIEPGDDEVTRFVAVALRTSEPLLSRGK